MNKESGYSNATVFIFILFMSTLALGLMSFIQISGNNFDKITQKYSSREELEIQAYLLIDQLAEDLTPQSDSLQDPIWDYLEKNKKGDIEISLEDISSKFNLNFMRTKILDESEFKNMFEEGARPEDLKLYRGEEGFFSDLKEGYGQFFEEKKLLKYFTTYSYANFNVSYEDSLKKLYEIRVSEEGSSGFLQKIQQLISEKTMADESKMKTLTGGDYDKLYPLINTLPLLNVNFVEEKILQAVLNYPYGGKKHEKSNTYFEIIKAERLNVEIDEESLELMMDLEKDHLRIKEYLGVRTWFWKIALTKENLNLEIIICLLPPKNSESKEKEYKIIRWEYH